MVHVDYTPKGAPLRLHSVLPDEAEELKKTPFAVIQVIPTLPSQKTRYHTSHKYNRFRR